MANGCGVTVSEVSGGKYRVRWRDHTSDGQKQRERVVSTHAAAVELQGHVLRALETVGHYVDPVRDVVHVPTVDRMIAGYLDALRARGRAESTITHNAGRLKHVLSAFRVLHKIPEDRGVPGELLNRDGVIAVTAELRRAGVLGPTEHSKAIACLLAVWGFASGDESSYPGVARVPYDTSWIAVERPEYAETVPPELHEVDAVIRRLKAGKSTTSLHFAVIARYTGLRKCQILALRVCDLEAMPGVALVPEADDDTEDDTEDAVPQGIRVVKGKGRRETAMRRRVPLHADLVTYLAPLIAVAREKGPETQILASEGDSKTIRAAWAAATAAGEVRRETWIPPQRTNGRPRHGFRAAFISALEEAGVPDRVQSYLVGHTSDMKGKHYKSPSDAALTAAIAKIAAIQWEAPKRNVVKLPTSR